MNSWIGKIQKIIKEQQQTQASTVPTRSQTLPAKVSSGEAVLFKEEPKKRGFFTLKKK